MFCRFVLVGVLVLGVATAVRASPINGFDLNGKVTPNDAACWVDPACQRDGDSDVMTIRDPTGAIFAQVFAFGPGEESGNLYYFDPISVPVNAAQFGNYTTLLEPPGDCCSLPGGVSDVFGVARLPTGALVLAFASDPSSALVASFFGFTGPIPGLTFTEETDAPPLLNPRPEGFDDFAFTKAYSVTMYLDPSLPGFTGDFRSDFGTCISCEVPEPATLTLLGVGLLGLAARRSRKATGRSR